MKLLRILLFLSLFISCNKNLQVSEAHVQSDDSNALAKMHYKEFFNEEFDLLYPLVLKHRTIEDEISAGTIKANYYRTRALLESYLGNYFNSVELTDKAKMQPTEMMVFDSLGNMTESIMYPEKAYSEYNHKKVDSLYKKIDFYEFVEKMKGPQVFSINEYHSISLFRNTWYELLPLLREKGYKYLVLESLFHKEGTSHNKDVFAKKNQGQFCSEVLSGQIIRKAKELGFMLISYDQQGTGSQVKRDTLSFDNIVNQTIRKDKNAKIVLYAGHAHISEMPIGRLKNFGTRFNEIGINPMTIHQFLYYERNMSEEIKAPTLLIPKGQNKLGRYDYNLLIPKTKLVKGRPHWLWEKDRVPVQVPKDKTSDLNYPCVIEAYLSNEPHEAVPLDRIELKTKSQEGYLALEKGNYRIVYTDSEGKKIKLKVKI